MGEVQIVGMPPLPGGIEGPFAVTTDKRGQRHAVLDFTLTLDRLAPGTYVLRVVARLNESESVTREVPFSIQ